MRCSSCGAPLGDGETIAKICGHCGTPAPTSQLASQGLQAELDAAERWWNEVRRPLMTTGSDGQLSPPEENSTMLIVLMALGGVLGMASAAAGHEWGAKLLGILGFFLFPIAISLPAALQHQKNETRYKRYQSLLSEYQGRRDAIIARHSQ